MSDTNKVIEVGRLTSDPELKYTVGGTAVLNITIAVGKSIPPRSDGGEWGNKTSFFDVVMFGKTAEAKAKNLMKGRQVAVTGELEQDRWEYEGKKYSKIKIVAESIQLLAIPQNQQEGKASGVQGAGTSSSVEDSGDFEDDIPF